MNEGLVLKLAAIVGGIFGLALVFMPNGLAAMYGAQPMNTTGVYNSMLFGSAFIGIATMNWAASSESAVGQRHYVMLGNFAGNFAGFLIALFRQLTSDAATAASWLNVGLFLLFAALFGYLYFRPQADARVTPPGERKTAL
jgi:hypothetical protein